ncbi:GNAT family N-acetyltransferase [Paenibacillus selenitireducens]|uniref:GNAT family N-acetyltransferase n=1 Tax=Paenibacillus selenitireducens TaxID=1324314 RepID=A0A1T2X6B6_9BACL|nr:GNAT family N-acetyltransferase [Paenibacillus selenitireducens]OPA75226.1 GNAT family N-acetyltransferase [Paenibacillus selenitireducens]
MKEQIPDKNIFMMCTTVIQQAFRELPSGYQVRSCTESELNIWKNFPFDNPSEAEQYHDFITQYFNDVYAEQSDLFYQKCLFVCDQQNRPVATCFAWKAYDRITTIHWFKVLKDYEGSGIGRALLSIVMRDLSSGEYLVFLHTQPSSYRAIKLYSDFGFDLLSDPVIGNRKNDLGECLPILQAYMPAKAYQGLRTTEAPAFFLEAANSSPIVQF